MTVTYHLTQAVEVVSLGAGTSNPNATKLHAVRTSGRTYCGRLPSVVGNETTVATNVTCLRCRHSLIWRGIIEVTRT